MLKIWFDDGKIAVPNELTIYNGDKIKVVHFIKKWFVGNYKDEWFEDEFVKHIVKEIDKSEIKGLCVMSPVLGSISIRDLSAGAITAITLYKKTIFSGKESMIYIGSCGDNCVPIIEEIGRRKDIMILCPCRLEFSDNIHAICLNDGVEINGYDQYFEEYLKHSCLYNH